MDSISIENIKKWLRNLAGSTHARVWLGIISATDSCVSPIPPDPLLAGMCYLYPWQWRRLAVITITASLIGAIIGYSLGFFLGPTVITWLETALHLGDELTHVAELYKNNAILTLFMAAFTPIPYKVFTVSAGLFGINFMLFFIVSIIGRGLRYVIVSYLAARFGDYGLSRFKKYLWWATIIVLAFLLLTTLY